MQRKTDKGTHHLHRLFHEHSSRLTKPSLLCVRSRRRDDVLLERIHRYCERHGFILQHSTIQTVRKSFATMVAAASNVSTDSTDSGEIATDIQLQLTHVNALPSRTEQGMFLIIELGNLFEDLRISLVSLLERRLPSYNILHSKGYDLPEEIRKSTGEILIDRLIAGLKEFMEEISPKEKIPRPLQTGLLLHFPTRQSDLHHVEILSWSDRFDCPDLLHRDLIVLLQQAIDQQLARHQIRIVASMRESVAALISVAFEYPNTFISLIFKRSFQASFVEDSGNLRSKHLPQRTRLRALYQTLLSLDFHPLQSGDSAQSHALFQTLLTSVDRYVMDGLKVNYVDLLTCDACLLEIVRVLILELCIHEQLLPYSVWTRSKLNQPGSLSPNFVAYLLQRKYTKLKPYLSVLGLKQLKKASLIYLEYICHVIVRRATQVLSCLVVCLAERYNEENLTVAIDSYLYRSCPIYQHYMHQEAEYLCKRWITMFHFITATNTSYVGPAVVMGLQKTQKAMISREESRNRLHVRRRAREYVKPFQLSHSHLSVNESF